MAGGNFGGGTGTQADPFIIEDWADLEACAADNSQKYYKVVNDLDANDRNDGVWQQIQFKFFSEIDYGGHKIRNIYTDGTESLFHFTQATSGSQTMTVKNLETKSTVRLSYVGEPTEKGASAQEEAETAEKTETEAAPTEE